ncbi:hypothetical protein EON65_52940 [archaeon]|nr:MAG: hypothetical protein EON65_52940 [archaeon]
MEIDQDVSKKLLLSVKLTLFIKVCPFCSGITPILMQYSLFLLTLLQVEDDKPRKVLQVSFLQ